MTLRDYQKIIIVDEAHICDNGRSFSNVAKLLSDKSEFKDLPPGYYNVEGKAAAEVAKQTFKIQSHIKPPKPRRKAGDVPKAVEKALIEYKAAYRALYGVAARVRFADGWFYIDESNMCDLKNFRNKIKQLRYRKG